MSETKQCSHCGYTATNEYDDFYDYKNHKRELTTCYFCMEISALIESKLDRNNLITYEVFSNGIYWLLNNIRQMNEGKK